MKRIRINIIAGYLLTAFFTINSFGQGTPNATDKMSFKLDMNSIPKVVIEPFYKDYPVRDNESWYGYPTYDYQNNWFDDWYGNGKFFHIDNPDYYVVEFSQNKIPAKVIYTKTGQKVAIHKSLTSDIPKAIATAISNGEYKTWKLGEEKEIIFKDSEKDELKVFKITVTKGNENHTLFYQPNGKLLQDKKVS